jgi:polysaccharide deacetylase 2 family uncharacterized protein YibQ
MKRRKPIRRAGGTRMIRKSSEAIFWLLLLLAIGVGGGRAVDGARAVATALLPSGLIAANPQDDKDANIAAPPFEPTPAVRPLVPPPSMPALRSAVRQQFGEHEAAARAEVLVSAGPHASAPKIAIVIDDLGADVAATRRAIALPKNVSLSFLPYPDTTPMLAAEALAAGHQILVHVPMEPEGNEDPGPMALETGLSAEENARRLEWAFGRVPGFSGINNHMGSRFTADRTALVLVVQALASRHAFFLDSRTTPDTQIVPLARESGVPSAGRDVFLDDETTASAVDAQIGMLEHLARAQGVAIAIGHPHAATLEVLEKWTVAARTRGYDLVTVGEAIRLKTSGKTVVSATIRQTLD